MRDRARVAGSSIGRPGCRGSAFNEGACWCHVAPAGSRTEPLRPCRASLTISPPTMVTVGVGIISSAGAVRAADWCAPPTRSPALIPFASGGAAHARPARSRHCAGLTASGQADNVWVLWAGEARNEATGTRVSGHRTLGECLRELKSWEERRRAYLRDADEARPQDQLPVPVPADSYLCLPNTVDPDARGQHDHDTRDDNHDGDRSASGPAPRGPRFPQRATHVVNALQPQWRTGSLLPVAVLGLLAPDHGAALVHPEARHLALIPPGSNREPAHGTRAPASGAMRGRNGAGCDG